MRMRNESKYSNKIRRARRWSWIAFTGWQLARARCWSLMDCAGLKVAPDTIPPRLPKVRLRDKRPTNLAGNKRTRNCSDEKKKKKTMQYFTH